MICSPDFCFLAIGFSNVKDSRKLVVKSVRWFAHLSLAFESVLDVHLLQVERAPPR